MTATTPTTGDPLDEHIANTSQVLGEALFTRIHLTARSLWPSAAKLEVRRTALHLTFSVGSATSHQGEKTFDATTGWLTAADTPVQRRLDNDVQLLLELCPAHPAVSEGAYSRNRRDLMQVVSRTVTLPGTPVPLPGTTSAVWHTAPRGSSASLWVGSRYLGQVRLSGSTWHVMNHQNTPVGEAAFGEGEQDRGRHQAQHQLEQLQKVVVPQAAGA